MTLFLHRSASHALLLLVSSTSVIKRPASPLLLRGGSASSRRRGGRRLLAILWLLTGLCHPATAQPDLLLSDASQISLITILPGHPVYSAFGHSAIRVFDPVQGIDSTYNYGTFDFDDPFFLPKFIYGELDYYLSTAPYGLALRFYTDYEHRPVIEQVLNLSAVQRQALFRFLQTNALPQNRAYRYDFLFDNCSTRIRDALEKTLGSAVRFGSQPDPQQRFRHLLDPYVADRPFLDLGFDLVLGTPTDRVATPREVVFLPRYLMEAFDHATVVVDGHAEPLVARKDTVFWAEDQGHAAAFPWPTVVAWGLLGIGLAAAIYQYRRGSTLPRWPDVLLFGTVGVLGLLMTFMWFGTLHHVTAHNWNLLWAWPTHVVAAGALARRWSGRWLPRYLWATAGGALVGGLGWSLWPQDLHPAVLPIMMLLAVRSAWLAYAGDITTIPKVPSQVHER